MNARRVCFAHHQRKGLAYAVEPSQSRLTACQLPRRGSFWRNRKRCGLPRNFTALPKPPSVREVASPTGLDGRSPYPNHSFSRTACDSSLKEGGSGETRKHCGLPGNFTALPRALPLGELASPTGLDGEGWPASRCAFKTVYLSLKNVRFFDFPTSKS